MIQLEFQPPNFLKVFFAMILVLFLGLFAFQFSSCNDEGKTTGEQTEEFVDDWSLWIYEKAKGIRWRSQVTKETTQIFQFECINSTANKWIVVGTFEDWDAGFKAAHKILGIPYSK